MRSHESPMDFQYENPLQPDPTSPFSLVNLGKSLNYDKNRPNLLKRACDTVVAAAGDWQDSPTKTTSVFSFSTPQTQFSGNSLFDSTKIQPRVEFNLQQETPGTDDQENATDDGGASEQDSPISAAPRASKRNKLSELAKQKIKRRRQKHLKDLQHEISPNDNDLDYPDTVASNHREARPWSLDHHRDLPYIVSGYLQLFFNISLLSILLYFLVSFMMTIQADVNKKVEEYSAEILAEISACSNDYLKNKCSPDQRVPGMQIDCQAWERCMERDPAKVGRARVSAETFAEIVNSLIEPISYKTMIFCLLLTFGSLFLSNFAFGLLRQRQHDSQGFRSQHHGAQAATFMIQATPQHPSVRSQKELQW